MKQKQIILNRAALSPDFIQKRQDFNSILTRVEVLRNPTMKRPWFFGAAGFSSIAIATFSLTNNVLINEKYDQKDTLKAKDTQHVVEKK
jgi:transcriptional accessory protein Tex/SPT6